MKKQLNQKSAQAFTLVELLVVIAIIALLAGLITATGVSVMQKARVKNVQGELANVRAAIEAYKAKKGFYPPDNARFGTNYNQQTNGLYYELAGISWVSNSGVVVYTTLDEADKLTNTAVIVNLLSSSGFANSSAGNKGDDNFTAENFLKGLSAKQAKKNSDGIKLLIAPVDGPDLNTFNPWRYNSSNPKYNTDSYDLWAVVMIGKVTNIVCNWSDNPIATTSFY